MRSLVPPLALTSLLLVASRRIRSPGGIFFAFLLLWGAARLALDQVRYYPPERTLLEGLGLLVHQPFVIALLAAGLVGLLWVVRLRPTSHRA